jgi:(R)-2-hydroxyacyl-CoA dehydratese activating ATPase
MSVQEIDPGSSARAALGLHADIAFFGVDIGSRQSKCCLINDGRWFLGLVPSGVDSQETAQELLALSLKCAGINADRVAWAVGTGYGRITLNFGTIPSETITEISCHGMGAHILQPHARTIVDIGGQDCKAIRVDPADGSVVEFAMNDRCAAGTGRFLERTAEMLGIEVEELGNLSLGSKKKIDMSSQCVVFAESEIVTLKARGESPADVAAGVHLATARRVKNLVGRIGFEPELVFSGGVSNNQGMRVALEALLQTPIRPLPVDPVFCGALGAAALATRSHGQAQEVRAAQ